MTGITLAARGPIPAAGTPAWRALFDRATSADETIARTTAAIVSRVRTEGDAALYALAREFDGASLDALEVPRPVWQAALDALDPALRRAMVRSVRNIGDVHAAFRPAEQEVTTVDGVVITRTPEPLARIGVYAPGGRAAYPSSVLMGVVPARVAGVAEVIVATPPGRDGRPAAVVLAAAELAGADRVFAIGGAGAIAAMAFGTRTVPRVDLIVGPGNAYVAEAKSQLAGVVPIDSPAGPSELLVLADGAADAEIIATEMIAQAEHDPQAAVVLVTSSETLAGAVDAALSRLVPLAPREAIIRSAFAARGAILDVMTMDDAIEFAGEYAAEHVLVCASDAPAVASRIRNAGTVFVGAASGVAFGDYMTGANHVLPTGGLARRYSGLSTPDFFRWTTRQRIDRAAAARMATDTGIFADAEALPGHAAAARQWRMA